MIVNEETTLTTFVSFNLLNNPEFVTYSAGTVGGILPAIVALIGVVIIAVLSKKNVKGAILWGLLGSAVLYYVFAGIAVGAGSQGAIDMFNNVSLSNPLSAFEAWGKDSVGVVFYEGFNFDQYLSTGTNNGGSLAVVLITSALSLCMIDMFDTIGTLYGACSKGNLLDKDGTPIRMEKMMLSDAIATCTGAIAGTSTVGLYLFHHRRVLYRRHVPQPYRPAHSQKRDGNRTYLGRRTYDEFRHQGGLERCRGSNRRVYDVYHHAPRLLHIQGHRHGYYHLYSNTDMHGQDKEDFHTHLDYRYHLPGNLPVDLITRSTGERVALHP